MKVIFYEQDSSSVFPQTDIKGGVVVTFRDSKKDFGPIKTFVVDRELRGIREKVVTHEFKSINSIHHNRSSYRLTRAIYTDNPSLKGRIKASEESSIGSNIFDKLPEIFKDKALSSETDIKVFGRYDNKRAVKWISKNYVQSHANLDKWKVFVPKSNGGGELGALSTPIVGEPKTIGTQTYISFGACDTKLEAENILVYLKTKFARALLGINKVTQDNATKEVWENVPLQDFTSESDIDWSKSIPEIDQQLYKKYDLSQEEIDFIETRVKAME